MNLERTHYQIKNLKKKIKKIKNISHHLSNQDMKKILPDLSCRNEIYKSRQRKNFSQTMGHFI